MKTKGLSLNYIFAGIGSELKRMPVVRAVCIVVIIKLLIMFLILKPIFFRDFLSSKSHDAKGKAEYVGGQLTRIIKQ